MYLKTPLGVIIRQKLHEYWLDATPLIAALEDIQEDSQDVMQEA